MKKAVLMLLVLVMAFAAVLGASADDKVKVVYWGTWGAEKQEYILQVIDEFNASQDKYEAVYEFVGGYGDLLAKLQVTNDEDLPALINSTVEAIGNHLYNERTVPISQFAGKDDPYYTMLYPNLIGTWSDKNDELIGYPMGNSMPGIYFNMDMMEQIGVDPYTDIKCLEDLPAVFKKLVDAGIVETVIGFDWANFYLNDALAIEGIHCVDNNNGKDDVPTKALYDQPGTIEYVERYYKIWDESNQAGYLLSPGASWGNEVLPAFATGKIALVTGTIGGYARLANAWKENHDTQCNIVFLPWMSITPEGRSTGLPGAGNGFFITKAADERAREGAWEFIKFWSEGDRAAYWCTITGYLPISDANYQSQIYQDYISNSTLDFQKLIDIQAESDLISFPPITPINTELQTAGINALSKVIADPNYGIDNAIHEFAAATNDALDMWHLEND